MADDTLRDALPIVFSAKILDVISDDLVYGKIADKEYEGEIKESGERVVIRGLGDVTIQPYTAADISYETPVDSAIFLDIDQKYYYGITLGDIHKMQTDLKVMTHYAKKAAYGLDKKVDDYIAALYTKTATGTYYVQDLTVDTDTVTSCLGELWEALEKVNVKNKWLVIAPWVSLKLQLAGIVKAEVLNGELKNGFIGKNLGFDIYQSNRCPVPSGSKTAVMAGSYEALAFCQQIIETEIIRLEKRFADAARGLHVWGAKCIKPKELFWADMTKATETKI
jgi:hypothetical protein